MVKILTKATCTPSPEVTQRAAEIEKARQAWGKKLGMADADWADAVAFANVDGAAERIKVSTKDFATMTPLDQYQVIDDGMSMPGGNRFDDRAYLTDAFEPNLTEVGRLAFIKNCITSRASQVGGDAAAFAICQGDLDAFDVAKFGTQLHADTAHDGAQKMQVRLQMYDLKATGLKEHDKDVKQIFEKDVAYKKLWDAAKQGRAEWANSFGKDATGLALMQKMDSAYFFQSRNGFAGCEATTGAALDAAIAKHAPVKLFKGLQDVRRDPYDGVAKVVGPALAAVPEIAWAAMPYVLCQPKRQRADFLAYFIQDTPGQRGPRAAAYSKMIAASVVLDNMSDKVEYPSYSRPYASVGGEMGSAGSTIKSVKVSGNVLEVELEKLIVKRMECISSHATNRITQITRNGSVVYESICDKSGIVAHDETWAPFKINKVWQPLLKKGVRFSAIYGGGGGDQGSDLIATWPSKTAPLPNTILGVPVK